MEVDELRRLQGLLDAAEEHRRLAEQARLEFVSAEQEKLRMLQEFSESLAAPQDLSRGLREALEPLRDLRSQMVAAAEAARNAAAHAQSDLEPVRRQMSVLQENLNRLAAERTREHQDLPPQMVDEITREMVRLSESVSALARSGQVQKERDLEGQKGGA